MSFFLSAAFTAFILSWSVFKVSNLYSSLSMQSSSLDLMSSDPLEIDLILSNSFCVSLKNSLLLSKAAICRFFFFTGKFAGPQIITEGHIKLIDISLLKYSAILLEYLSATAYARTPAFSSLAATSSAKS